MKQLWYYEFPIGQVGIAADEIGITDIFFAGEKLFDDLDRTETPLIQKAAYELSEYFAGTRKTFNLPLHPHGTSFQLEDWNALRNIPYGKTCSYQDIAIAIGRPKACRAVGMANHNNPIAIVIPCHRVIGKNGSLTGYGGGLEIKQYLLTLEEQYA